MDSEGRFYAASPAVREALEAKLIDKLERVRDSKDIPPDSIEVSGMMAVKLAERNRSFRRAYFAERRRGFSEEVAFAAAEGRLPDK
jgi:hypothetical protein